MYRKSKKRFCNEPKPLVLSLFENILFWVAFFKKTKKRHVFLIMVSKRDGKEKWEDWGKRGGGGETPAYFLVRCIFLSLLSFLCCSLPLCFEGVDWRRILVLLLLFFFHYQVSIANRPQNQTLN